MVRLYRLLADGGPRAGDTCCERIVVGSVQTARCRQGAGARRQPARTACPRGPLTRKVSADAANQLWLIDLALIGWVRPLIGKIDRAVRGRSGCSGGALTSPRPGVHSSDGAAASVAQHGAAVRHVGAAHDLGAAPRVLRDLRA